MFSGSLSSAPIGSTKDLWETTEQNLLVISVKHKVKLEASEKRRRQGLDDEL